MPEFGGLWKHEKTQHTLYVYLGLGRATLLLVAFLGESDPNFPSENVPQWDNTVYKIYKIQEKYCYPVSCQANQSLPINS